MRILRLGEKKDWGRNRLLSDLKDRQMDEERQTPCTPRCRGHRMWDRQPELQSSWYVLVPVCVLDTTELCQLAVEGWHELTQSTSQRSYEQNPEPDLKAEQVDSVSAFKELTV